MKAVQSIVLLAAVLIISCTVVLAGGDRRLISTATNKQEWLTEEQINELIKAGKGFMDITAYPTRSAVVPPPVPPVPEQPVNKELVGILNGNLRVENIAAVLTELQSFHTRYYQSPSGVEAAKWIAQRLQDIAERYEDNGMNLAVELVEHSWPQPSVIATIFGEGDNANQVVVIGAHLDSVTQPVTNAAPGADDDGTGVSTLIEIWRVLITYGYFPDRTIKFIFYAAEEAGLLGSQVIANRHLASEVAIYGTLQVDMTGYGGNEPFQPIGVITDFVDANLTQFLRIVIDTYSILNWANSVCGYGCSDHASWTRAGYRSAFPFETVFPNRNPYIHTGSDTLDKLSPVRLLELTKVALGWTVEMAGAAIHTMQ